MKRALKKREKAVLENTQSEDVPVEQQNINTQNNRRVSKKAAMIGLAISMGATSLLVTRQSDQALAAEPVGNQNTASTIPAADAEVKFAPTNNLRSETVSSVIQPENTVVVEPTAISQVPGLGAKWQVAANVKSVQATAPVVVSSKSELVNKLRNYSANNNVPVAKKQFETGKTTSNTYGVVAQPQTAQAQGFANTEVDAQLKAQQEFALTRLQEKSDRLRASLAELQSEENQEVATNTVEEKAPQTITGSTFTQQSETVTESSKADLVSKLKQKAPVNVPTAVAPTPATPTVVTPSQKVAYEVKSGDTLAAIASANGTSVSELAKANNLANPNQLQISQKLIIPTAVERNTATAFDVSSTTEVANTSVNSVIAHNSNTTVGATVDTNNQIQVNTESTTVNSAVNTPINPQTFPTANSAYGMGGDSPIPTSVTEMQLARRQDNTKVKSTKTNPRLRGLQAEIENLRKKYRAQQSGNSVVIEQTNTDNSAVEVPISEPNNAAVPIPVSRPNNAAVTIPVPQPGIYNYSAQPVKPSFAATRSNEAVNPEFVNRRNQIATPPVGVDASESLGARRGTQVSPELPPLAAVDRYLPRPIDEVQTSSTGYMWPAKGVLTSGYGWRWGRMHKGIDVANSVGTPIYASADGVIEKAGWNKGGYGNLVDIRHADGSMTRYGHNSKILVRAGQQVRKGDTIALMGSTGFSTGPHTHFEIHPSGKGAVNPIALLPQERL